MRFVFCFVSVLAVALCHGAAHGQDGALFDELAPLYPDSDLSGQARPFRSDTPRGVVAGVHALITGLPPNAEVSWRVGCNGEIINDARVFRLIDVPVEQNTGLDSRTEAWKDKKNPHVIRRAPFRVFEVLEPIQSPVAANEAGVLALRIEVPIAADAEPEERRYALLFKEANSNGRLNWKLTVHPVTVPPMSSKSPGYTNWFSTSNIAKRHDLEPWSEPFWKMLGAYADLMARGRQNTFLIGWRNFALIDDKGKVSFDEGRFRRYMKLFLDRGFTRLEGGHLAHRHKGDWGSPRLDTVLGRTNVSSEAGKAEIAALLAEVRKALDKSGLTGGVTYLQHLTDEPTDKNAETYKMLAADVRRHMPGVKIFEATMSQALTGAVDHWCPQVQKYQEHREFFEGRKKSGEAVWVYTCLVPGGPWLNRLLDQERLRPVYIGWSLVKYDLDGFLHWGLNHYRKDMDPFNQSVIVHGEGPANNFLPAGDTHVVYPGKGGPWSGQRFEAHRIGMEDAELLAMLKARDAKAAETIIAKVFRAYDDYEQDVSAYRAAKRELLAALSSPDKP